MEVIYSKVHKSTVHLVLPMLNRAFIRPILHSFTHYLSSALGTRDKFWAHWEIIMMIIDHRDNNTNNNNGIMRRDDNCVLILCQTLC